MKPNTLTIGMQIKVPRSWRKVVCWRNRRWMISMPLISSPWMAARDEHRGAVLAPTHHFDGHRERP
jgi:hypothetical protein